MSQLKRYRVEPKPGKVLIGIELCRGSVAWFTVGDYGLPGTFAGFTRDGKGYKIVGEGESVTKL